MLMPERDESRSGDAVGKSVRIAQSVDAS